jgi:hypothetical protein
MNKFKNKAKRWLVAGTIQSFINSYIGYTFSGKNITTIYATVFRPITLDANITFTNQCPCG